jgi:hypothetical protein
MFDRGISLREELSHTLVIRKHCADRSRHQRIEKRLQNGLDVSPLHCKLHQVFTV